MPKQHTDYYYSSQIFQFKALRKCGSNVSSTNFLQLLPRKHTYGITMEPSPFKNELVSTLFDCRHMWSDLITSTGVPAPCALWSLVFQSCTKSHSTKSELLRCALAVPTPVILVKETQMEAGFPPTLVYLHSVLSRSAKVHSLPCPAMFCIAVCTGSPIQSRTNSAYGETSEKWIALLGPVLVT